MYLTGGELPAMVVTDAVARMIPGVFRCGQWGTRGLFFMSLFWSARNIQSLQNLEGGLFQMYCAVVIIKILPHGVKGSTKRTRLLRPDLLERPLTNEEVKLLKEIIAEESRL